MAQSNDCDLCGVFICWRMVFDM